MITAWGLGPAQPTGQHSAQLLLVLLGPLGGREGLKMSGHHATALGNPPPEVVTVAAEGHLGCFLEDCMDVFLEQG